MVLYYRATKLTQEIPVCFSFQSDRQFCLKWKWSTNPDHLNSIKQPYKLQAKRRQYIWFFAPLHFNHTHAHTHTINDPTQKHTLHFHTDSPAFDLLIPEG